MTTIEQAAFNQLLERIKGDFIDAGLPEHMWGGVKRYLLHGIAPGHFLTSVMCNDLAEAVGRADAQNINLLPNYVRFFYNAVPGGCWHSRANVDAWMARGGFMGGAGQ